MAGIRKKEWRTKDGVIHSRYEITYYALQDGVKVLKRKSGYKTRREAQEDLPNVINQFNSNITFEKLAHNYLELHCPIHCKESTAGLYKGFIDCNLAKLKPFRASQVKQKDINALMLDFKRRGMGNKTINNIMFLLTAIYNFAIEQGHISEIPFAKPKKLQLEPREMSVLSEELVDLFLETAKKITPGYYALFYTAFYTGMRRGELFALEWADVDIKNKTININKQRYQGKITSTKTHGSTRKIEIDDTLLEVLKTHKAQKRLIGNIVFSNSKGDYLHPYHVSETYFKAVLSAMADVVEDEKDFETLKRFRFHDMRHTHATILLSNSAPIKYVSTRLGHSNCNITLNTYNHVMKRDANISMGILANLKKYEHKMSIENEKPCVTKE